MNHIAKYLILELCLFTATPTPPIRLPSSPVIPVPPAPSPDSAITLNADQLYVVDSDVPFLVFTSPNSFLKVTKDTGPLKIRGKFVDGTTTETRTFNGKYLAIVETTGTGRSEIIIVPDGAKVETDAIRRLIDANNGPIPPPIPIPVPPVPVPISPLTQSLQTAFTAETDIDKATQLPKIIDLMSNIVVAAKSSGKVLTTKNLFDTLHQALDLSLGAGKMPSTRAAIGTYLGGKLPTTVTTMTDATWNTAATEFTTIATALKGVR